MVIPGVNDDYENINPAEVHEERLLRDESEMSEEEMRKDDGRRETEMSREKAIEIVTEGSELENLKTTTSKIRDEKTKSDEVLEVVKDFCIRSTNTTKQYQEALIETQAAEKIQKSIINEFEKQKEAFAMQTKAMEQTSAEVKRQLGEIRANYNKIMNCCNGIENKNKDEDDTRGETTSQKESDKLNIEVSNLVKRELEKIKLGERVSEKENSDSLVNKVKETLEKKRKEKFEIISRDSGLRRDYKLTLNTNYHSQYHL